MFESNTNTDEVLFGQQSQWMESLTVPGNSNPYNPFPALARGQVPSDSDLYNPFGSVDSLNLLGTEDDCLLFPPSDSLRVNLQAQEQAIATASRFTRPQEAPAANQEEISARPANLSIDPLTGEIAGSPSLTPSNLVTDAGNTLATARQIVGIENNQITVTEFVSSEDLDDYYAITLTNQTDLTLQLGNLSNDADLLLIKDKNGNKEIDLGEIIGISSEFENTPERIDFLGLQPGTYYVDVYAFEGATNYNLTLTGTPSSGGFKSDSGYGLLNANAAVATTLNSPFFPPSPKLGGHDWPLDTIHAPDVWTQGITGAGIVVAVVDTGVDYNHVDLQNNIWTNPREIPNNGLDDDGNGFVDDVRGWDFVANDNDPMDRDREGHGTHVAGAIAAERNNIGITGVAYNARIMPVRVLNAEGEGTLDDIANGIIYAANNGAQVINVSLGGYTDQTQVEDAINYAGQKGAVVTIAAGNNGWTAPISPADSANRWSIAVGASDRNDRLAEYSNWAGPKPLNYLVAPGTNIYSTTPYNTYESYDGTSMAAPFVAGTAALVLSANPSLTPEQVASILTATADRHRVIT